MFLPPSSFPLSPLSPGHLICRPNLAVSLSEVGGNFCSLFQEKGPVTDAPKWRINRKEKPWPVGMHVRHKPAESGHWGRCFLAVPFPLGRVLPGWSIRRGPFPNFQLNPVCLPLPWDEKRDGKMFDIFCHNRTIPPRPNLMRSVGFLRRTCDGLGFYQSLSSGGREGLAREAELKRGLRLKHFSPPQALWIERRASSCRGPL